MLCLDRGGLTNRRRPHRLVGAERGHLSPGSGGERRANRGRPRSKSRRRGGAAPERQGWEAWDGAAPPRRGDEKPRRDEGVFQLELEGGKAKVGDPGGAAKHLDERLKSRLRELCSAQGEFACKLLEDIRRLRDEPGGACAVDEASDEGDVSVLAKSLTGLGYLVLDPTCGPVNASVNAANGAVDGVVNGSVKRGRAGRARCGFLTVKPGGSDEDGEGNCHVDSHVVEPHFKSQFVIQAPTQRYSELLDVLPDEYVGPAARMWELVRILCREMADAFHQTGRPLPPWRSHDRVWSKWSHTEDPSPTVHPPSDHTCGQAGALTTVNGNSPEKHPEAVPQIEFRRLTQEEVREGHRRRRSRERSLLSGAMRYRARPIRRAAATSPEAVAVLHAPERRGQRGRHHGSLGARGDGGLGRGRAGARPAGDGRQEPRLGAAPRCRSAGAERIIPEPIFECRPPFRAFLEPPPTSGPEESSPEVASDVNKVNNAVNEGGGHAEQSACASIMARYEQGWFGLAMLPPAGANLGAAVH